MIFLKKIDWWIQETHRVDFALNMEPALRVLLRTTGLHDLAVVGCGIKIAWAVDGAELEKKLMHLSIGMKSNRHLSKAFHYKAATFCG